MLFKCPPSGKPYRGLRGGKAMAVVFGIPVQSGEGTPEFSVGLAESRQRAICESAVLLQRGLQHRLHAGRRRGQSLKRPDRIGQPKSNLTALYLKTQT